METTGARTRNKRGHGVQLHDDIVTAAGRLLEETGQDDAVTLRAVARRVGITAPSIYGHFAGRDDIVCAVVARTFTELTAVLRPVADQEDDPVRRLTAVSRAYLDFATERPNLYRVLFERRHSKDSGPADPVDVLTMVGAEAFGVLLDAVRACVDAGASSETSPQLGAVRVWVGLHGLATLRASLPWFPWPPLETLLDDLVTRLADLT